MNGGVATSTSGMSYCSKCGGAIFHGIGNVSYGGQICRCYTANLNPSQMTPTIWSIPQTGWLCPKCNQSNAPWMPTCGSCKK